MMSFPVELSISGAFLEELSSFSTVQISFELSTETSLFNAFKSTVHGESTVIVPDISVSGGGEGLSEEQLMAFVAELPDGCRTVFNLYVFEEKSHKEIAKLLHIKEHSSTSQLHRAKYLLAKRIKEYRNHEERK